MILEILKPYWKWKPGDTPDVNEEIASDLISQGYAIASPDQRRRDYTPKPQAESPAEPQKIEVNNYYLPPEYYEADEIQQEKTFFQRLKDKIWQP